MVVIKSLQKLKDHSKVGSWLLAITHNKSIDWLKQSKRRSEVTEGQVQEQVVEKTENNEQLISMRKAIKELSDDHQLVLNYFTWKD